MAQPSAVGMQGLSPASPTNLREALSTSLRSSPERVATSPADTGLPALRIVRIGDYDDCACIGAHVSNTSGIGEFRIISHDFNDGGWRVRWKVIAKQ